MKELATNIDLFMLLVGAGLALGIRIVIVGIYDAIMLHKSRRYPFDGRNRR